GSALARAGLTARRPADRRAPVPDGARLAGRGSVVLRPPGVRPEPASGDAGAWGEQRGFPSRAVRHALIHSTRLCWPVDWRASSSVRAAMIKSLRCRPPILWVHQVTVTLPHS